MAELLTTEQVKTIYRNHGFSNDAPALTNVGFRNQVYIGEHAVLKVYPEDNRSGYQKERWFYETAKLDCIPKMLASGDSWLLLERIHGVGLFRLWRDLTDDEREVIVRQIADIARSVSEIDVTDTEDFLPYCADYRAHFLHHTDQMAERLRKIGGIREELLTRAMAYVREHAHLLDDSKQYLIYNDLHFDNLMVTNEGKVILLDFEMLEIGPLDLVLDVWQRMMIHPFTYANEDDHPLTHATDYRKLLFWMQKYAREFFFHPQVRRRVNLYGIRYELDILCDYPMAEWPMERLEKYLCEDLW